MFRFRALEVIPFIPMNPIDPLDDLLCEWQVASEPPPTLRRDVWARIAAGRAEPFWWETLAVVLLRPRIAALTGFTAICLGSSLAALSYHRTPTVDPHTAYVRSISPFSAAHMAGR